MSGRMRLHFGEMDFLFWIKVIPQVMSCEQNIK